MRVIDIYGLGGRSLYSVERPAARDEHELAGEPPARRDFDTGLSGELPPAKPWWQSRGVLGGLVAAAAGLGAVFGLEIDQAETLEIAMAASAAVGGLMAVYGRVRATKPIRRRQ